MFKFAQHLVLVTLAFSLSHQALADAPRAYMEFEKFKGATLFVDGKAYEPRFWSGWSHAREAFTADAEALQHFDSYLSDLKTSHIVLWGGLAADLAFLAYASNNPDQVSDRTKSGIYHAGLIGAIFGSAYYTGSALEHFNKAINTYNGVYRQKTSKQSASAFEFVPGLWASERKGSQELAPSLGFKFSF